MPRKRMIPEGSRIRRFAVLFLIVLSGLMMLSTASAGREKPRLWIAMSEEADAADRVECWVSTKGEHYFFLPAYYQADHLFLFHNSGETILLDGRKTGSGEAVSFSPGQKVTVTGNGFSAFTITIMQSANIPAVFIDTESGNMETVHSYKGAREAGSMYMKDDDGTLEYAGSLAYIRSRGNSTFDCYPKKPYQIKLQSSAALCGMKKNKTFILLANYLDRSEIRNTLALDLARYSGAYAFTPACQSVDLYLNHSYAGCYLLTEKCEIDKDRLNITDLESALEKANPEPLESYPFAGKKRYSIGATRSYAIPNEPEDITGGYLILANNTEYFQKEASGFVTKRGQAFTMQEPKYASTLEIEYISSVMQEIENGLFSADGKDPNTGRHYSELLDMKSFVNRYLQSETLNDFDGQRPYFYKDSDTVDSKVYCAPVWDQDNILGASARRGKANYISLDREQMRSYYWFTRAVKQPDFRAEMIRTYYAVYRPAYLIMLGEETDETGTLRSIDSYTEEVRDSELMDHIRWDTGVWKQKSGGNTAAGTTPEKSAAFLKDFIRIHMQVMDKSYPNPDK